MDQTLLLNSSSPSRLLRSTLFQYSITSQNVHSLYDVYVFNAMSLLPMYRISSKRNQNIPCPLADRDNHSLTSNCTL
jgi:hypothetical protein